MGVIKQPFLKKKVVIAEINSAEHSTAPPTDDESVASSGQATPLPRNTRTPAATPVSPAQLRRGLGARLRLKQGRRTKQRCENEKLLMAMYGIDEETLTGDDIQQASRSYFQDLLHSGNEELLEQFVNNEEPRFFSRQKLSRRDFEQSEENFEPEEAFLKIGANMRQALKKHLPLGMLEGIESQVTKTFLADPNSEFIFDNLSSFERLLLHASCAYNALNSHSFDFGGKRIVRVENPYGKFFLRDPSLCKYLTVRGAGL